MLTVMLIAALAFGQCLLWVNGSDRLPRCDQSCLLPLPAEQPFVQQQLVVCACQAARVVEGLLEHPVAPAVLCLPAAGDAAELHVGGCPVEQLGLLAPRACVAQRRGHAAWGVENPLSVPACSSGIQDMLTGTGCSDGLTCASAVMAPYCFMTKNAAKATQAITIPAAAKTPSVASFMWTYVRHWPATEQSLGRNVLTSA